MTILLERPVVAPFEDDVTRREFLTSLAAAGLLAACGGGNEDGEATPGESARAKPTTRTITHPGGTTEVPARAVRVVTLSEALDGHLSSVGLAPLGAVDDVGEWLAPYRELLDPAVATATIAGIGAAAEPNYEAIAGLRPDLILAENFSADLYPTLAKIAPTVLIDRPTNAAWKSAFDQSVNAVGREDEAEAVRARYQTVLDLVSSQTGDLEISFIRANPEGTFVVDGTDRFAGSVATEAAFRTTDVPADVPDSFEVSPERLDLVTGGLIVLPARRADLDTVAAFEKNPLWASLGAVKAGRVVALPNPVYNGGTYVAAELLLKAIGKAVG